MFNDVHKFSNDEATELFNKYLKLGIDKRDIVNVCTVIYHSIYSGYVRQIIHLMRDGGYLNVDKELKALAKLGLITDLGGEFAISRAPRELILEHLSTQPEFESVKSEVSDFLKAHTRSYYAALRIFRIALYGNDVGDIIYWYNKSNESRRPHEPLLAVSVFNSPFSEAKLKLLPLDIQHEVLNTIVSYQLRNGLEDSGVMVYCVNNYSSLKDKIDFFNIYLLGSVGEKNSEISIDHESNVKLTLIERIKNNQWEDSHLFDNGADSYIDASVIYQMVALINIGNRDDIEAFLDIIDFPDMSTEISHSVEPIYSYCEIIMGREYAINIPPDILDPLESDSLYGTWVRLLILKWIDDPSYDKKLKAILGEISTMSMPMSDFFVKEFNDLAENRGVVTLLKPLERWDSVLTGVTNYLKKSKAKPEKDERLAWRLSRSSHVINFIPVIQKRSKNGKWTQGRKADYYDLPHNYSSFNHTENDKKMVSIGTDLDSYRSSYEKHIEMAKLAIGHKHLYDDNSRDEVTLVEVPLAIESKKVKGYVNLKVTPTGISSNLMSIKKKDNLWSITFLTDEQLSIVKIIGDKLKVPSDQVFKLTEFFTAIEPLVSIKGEIKSLGSDLERFKGEVEPQVFITPYDNGLEFKIRVVPSNDNQFFIPGIGKDEYIGSNEDVSVVVVRDLEREGMIAKDFIDSISLLKDQYVEDYVWQFPDNLEALEILEDLNNHKLSPTLNWPQGEKIKILKSVTSSSLFNSVNKQNEWFEVSGEAEIDSNRVVSLKQLMALSDATASRFIQLDTGEYIALTKTLKSEIDTLNTYSHKSKGESVKIHPLAMFAMQDSHMGREFSESKKWIKQFKENHEKHFNIPSSIKAELRDYQEDGFKWIMRLAESGAGALLADDMGLGKTLQAISMLTARKVENPSLVVVPASLIYNWDSEIRKFSPSLTPYVLGMTERDELIETLKGGDVLIVSYGIVQRNSKLFTNRKWSTMVLDEAQAVKNSNTKRTKAIISIPRDFTLITTGTPIENHLGELWSLFNIILPGFLGSASNFREKYQEPIEKSEDREVRKRLKRLISPFILRRTKEEVLTELPAKTEVDLLVDMSMDEKVFYEALRQRAVENLENSSDDGDHRFKVLAEITKLRQASCHPKLADKKSTITSSKLSLFSEKVTELIGTKHQALVFSQFVGHLKIIAENLDRLGVPYFYLDGSTPAKKRGGLVDGFQNGEKPIFLISLKAGGSGLNLTAADYVFHMDPWWNPAVEDQASDRAHRIGQYRPVTVYRLITAGTIEEKIISMHKNKRNLAESLLNDSGSSLKIDTKELISIISGK